jgi:hypothetical protein
MKYEVKLERRTSKLRKRWSLLIVHDGGYLTTERYPSCLLMGRIRAYHEIKKHQKRLRPAKVVCYDVTVNNEGE